MFVTSQKDIFMQIYAEKRYYGLGFMLSNYLNSIGLLVDMQRLCHCSVLWMVCYLHMPAAADNNKVMMTILQCETIIYCSSEALSLLFPSTSLLLATTKFEVTQVPIDATWDWFKGHLLISKSGAASDKPPIAQETSDVHPRRCQCSRWCSTWRERSTGNQCVSLE